MNDKMGLISALVADENFTVEELSEIKTMIEKREKSN